MRSVKRILGTIGTGALALSLAAVATPAAQAQDSLTWGPCPESSHASKDAFCTTFKAPKDYAHPEVGSITLTMSKIPASSGHSRGVIAGNPGGPGGSAVGMFNGANDNDPDLPRATFPPEVRANYDLIAVEPRGLAYGEPLTCEIDGAPMATLGMQLSAGLTRELCNYAQPGMIDNVTTENTARDLDVARQKLGQDKINLYGLSYGGLLMSTYATLFPQHTDRTVLDSSMAQADQYAGIGKREPARRDTMNQMFQWIADRDSEYGLGDTPLKVYQRWSKVVERQVGVPAQMTPPPAQIGDLPPALAAHSGQALPIVNQALPSAWRLYSAVNTIGRGKPGATGSSPLFVYTYLVGLYNDAKWPKVAEFIRDGKLDEAVPANMDDEQVLKDVARQQITYGLVERAIICNENRVPIRPELSIPHQIDMWTGGDIIHAIEGAFITGSNCAGWPLPRPALTVTGEKLQTKPLLLGFSHDNAVGGHAIWDMQRRMGGETVVLDGTNHGVLITRPDAVTAKVNSYFGV